MRPGRQDETRASLPRTLRHHLLCRSEYRPRRYCCDTRRILPLRALRRRRTGMRETEAKGAARTCAAQEGPICGVCTRQKSGAASKRWSRAAADLQLRRWSACSRQVREQQQARGTRGCERMTTERRERPGQHEIPQQKRKHCPKLLLTSMLKPSVALVVAVSHMRNKFTQRSVRERWVRSTNICRWIKLTNRGRLSSELQAHEV